MVTHGDLRLLEETIPIKVIMILVDNLIIIWQFWRHISCYFLLAQVCLVLEPLKKIMWPLAIQLILAFRQLLNLRYLHVVAVLDCTVEHIVVEVLHHLHTCSNV